MSRESVVRFAKIALWATLVVAVALSASGCGQKAAQKDAQKGTTAKGLYETAKSQLSTTAPDAKLLVVQTAAAVPATGTPTWAYLFGSPKSDKIYIVYVDKGKAQPATEYGSAGLSEEEWKAVPGIDDWKVDSDEAYDKALEASGAKGAPVQWVAGLVTYIPKKSEVDTVKPFVWNFNFDPGKSGATTATVQVDGKTGETSVSK